MFENISMVGDQNLFGKRKPGTCSNSAQHQRAFGHVISNDNVAGQPRADQALSVIRTMESLVRASVEALSDAKDLARQVGLHKWSGDHIAQHIVGLGVDTLPELQALIKRLEVEARR